MHSVAGEMLGPCSASSLNMPICTADRLGQLELAFKMHPAPTHGIGAHKNNLTMPSPTREVAATYKIRIEHPSCCYHVGDQNSKVEMEKGQSSDGETVGSKGGHGPGWYDPDSP